MNKEDLLKQFWKVTLKEMKERHCHMINLDNIVTSISKYIFLRKQQNQAILDATGTNPVNLHGERKI